MRVILFLWIWLAPLSFAGGEMGNGTDNFSLDHGTAWFLGHDKTIWACIESSPSFGPSTDSVRTELLAAFATWIDYIEQRAVDKQLFDTPDMQFARQLQVALSCNGTEDLKIYLGVENVEIIAAKQKFEDPTAFVYRTDFDRSQAWGKGFIWLTNKNSMNWLWNAGALRAVLLHELGHILGVGHVTGTVMDENLSTHLSDYGLPLDTKQSIDWSRSLDFCFNCAVDLKGSLGVGTEIDEDIKVFARLMGRRARGAMQVKIFGQGIYNGLQLQLADDDGVQNFPIQIPYQAQSPVFYLGEAIFKRLKDQRWTYQQSEGHVLFGALKVGQQNLNAVIELNTTSASGMLALKELREGAPHTIFQSLEKWRNLQ